jgi:NTE family protein
MNVQLLRSTNRTIKQRRLPFETVALVLLGGGAINAALIAGNPPKERVDRLHAFCTQVTSGRCLPWFGDSTFGLVRGDVGRHILNQMSAGLALTSGARGFFKTRPVWPWFQPAGTIEATSFSNTGISSAH